MDAVAKVRQPLRHDKGGYSNVTLKRKEFKKAEDVKLITHFAQWLSDLTEMPIQADSFPEDLMDGIALCKLMMRIDGSGVVKYHPIKIQNGKMEMFKARENVASFQAACKRLDLPTSFGIDELESGDLGTIASTLVYVAHAAALRNVGVKELDDTLRSRLGMVVRENQEEDTTQSEPDIVQAQTVEVKPDDPPAVAEATAVAEPESSAPPTVAVAANAITAPQNYRYVGLSLSFLKSLFTPEIVKGMSVSKVATQLIGPLVTSKLKQEGVNASLAEVVFKEHSTDAQICREKADLVVCYDPDMQWSDLLAALDSSAATANVLSSSGTAAFWLEACSMFQSEKKQSLDTEQEIKNVIETVGRLEMVMTPWEKPSIALKSQSVWQVCCAITAKAPMFACFTPKDQDAFLEAVYGGFVGSKTFQKIFYDVNVERAVSSDPEQILRVLRVLRNEVGATRVNDAFIIPIKNWILDALKTAAESGISNNKKSNLYMTRGAFHQCIGQPDEARRHFDRVLECQQQIFPTEQNPSTATALSNMASTLRELGEFKEAELVCEKALKIRVGLYGESHPAVLVSRAWLGDILLASGEYARALPILEKVLEDQQKAKASDIEISSAMNNLASAMREVGRMDEARKYFEEVLNRVERSAGADHPLYGAALNNCALTLEAQKDYKSALKMHEKSLALRVRALGPQHPDVALSMHNLGVCLLREDKVKNFTQAADLGKKALQIWEKTLGPKHPTVIEARKDWGDLIK